MGPRAVLVLSADRNFAAALQDVICAPRFELRLFSDISQFMDACSSTVPAVAIIDETDILEWSSLRKARRALYGDAPIIVVLDSAASDRDAVNALSMDADDVLFKPVRPAVIRVRLEIALKNFANRRSCAISSDRLREQDRAWVSRIIDNLSGELAVVSAFREMLRKNIIFRDRESRLNEMDSAVDRAMCLTQQIQSSMSNDVPRNQYLDLRELVPEKLKSLSPLLPGNINLDINTESSCRLIKGNASGIERLIFNLVLNARDDMPNGGVIAVTLKNVVVGDPRAARRHSVPHGEYVLLGVTQKCGLATPKLSARLRPVVENVANEESMSLIADIVKHQKAYLRITNHDGEGPMLCVYWHGAPAREILMSWPKSS